LAISVLCVSEILRVWFDRTLYIAAFKYSKNGQDQPASGAAFAHILQQQKAALWRLFSPADPADHNIFASPLDIKGVHIGQLDVSDIADIKVEAQGINITALLDYVRRGVSTPNEISGAVSEVDTAFHVYASWGTAPHPSGKGHEPMNFALRPAPDLATAGFELACRVIRTQLVPRNKGLLGLSEDDFCAFAYAWASFDEFLAARDSEERRKSLEPRQKRAKAALDRLTTRSDTRFPYAWKLAAYMAIEESLVDPQKPPDAGQLDQAQQSLEKYLTLLAADKKDDDSARERLAFLKARKEQARVEVAAAVTGSSILGRSLGAVGHHSVASACCVVLDESGLAYVVTADYALTDAKPGTPVLSPAPLDGGDPARPIGVVAQVLPRQGRSGGLALVRLHDPNAWRNSLPGGGKVGGLSDVQLGQKVQFFGRTSGSGEAEITQTNTTLRPGGQQMFEDMFAAPAFSQGGDGGGPVIDKSSRLIGLIYDSTHRQQPNGLTFVLPLRQIFEQHKLKLAD
jgi:hypothetical protein